ncbi:hypothetical protein CYMTET_27414 [Cymbomonas tetramitiformis]|uniref:Glycerol-3-phosphate dehydrogenase [NAD(+)] n=1 Tax=Cymbomonas tetramitiformis TaxID=36881 RepID=A0AAE0FQ40_9CHLO|nr:hypothetical protein CYMTET_27414 [Cymbomonas tetramitiformis]
MQVHVQIRRLAHRQTAFNLSNPVDLRNLFPSSRDLAIRAFVDNEAASDGRPVEGADKNYGQTVVDGESGIVEDAASDKTVNVTGVLTDDERVSVQTAWDKLLRWSRISFGREQKREAALVESIHKVTVFGGGSFGTAMATVIARNKPEIAVVMLVRDEKLAASITAEHTNTRYFQEFDLPHNITATTNSAEALADSDFVIHAVPVQHSRAFLSQLRDQLPATMPLVSVSKGLEIGTGEMMSEVVVSSLQRPQPFACLSGPSFAVEMMQGNPTALVVASEDLDLPRLTQWLIASPDLRVNTSHDVVGVEIAGALKNVLAIAAGIVEGLDLGHNAMAALVSQGCSEIRWLGEKMGASPATLSGLSGVGDIMLTCFVNLSRNRTVGVRLGSGEKVEDVMSTTSQVAEGVATAGAVVSLARKYHVSMPVLTAVARILDGQSTPRDAVMEVMKLPQVPEV